MSKKLLLACAVVVALALQTAIAGENEGGGNRGAGRGGAGTGMRGMMGMRGMRGMGMGFMRRLDLAPEQQKKMVDVLTENFRENLLARMEMDEAWKKLAELRKADAVDGGAIIAANQALGTARGKLDVLRRTFFDKMKAVLTPEQRKKLEDARGMRRHRGGRDDDGDDRGDCFDDDDGDRDDRDGRHDRRDRKDRRDRRERRDRDERNDL